jgi:hypothetical protein
MALTLGSLPLYIVPSPLAYTTSKVVLFARVERALDTVLLEGILSPARTRDLPVSTIMAERQQRETANSYPTHPTANKEGLGSSCGLTVTRFFGDRFLEPPQRQTHGALL